MLPLKEGGDIHHPLYWVSVELAPDIHSEE